MNDIVEWDFDEGDDASKLPPNSRPQKWAG